MAHLRPTSCNNNESTRLIFTYGTLKRGFPNHPLMQGVINTRDAIFRGEYTTVKPFPLVIGPNGVPFIINLPGLGQRVRGELYEVTGRGLVPLDELEGVTTGHYERLPVEVVVAEGGGDGSEVVVKVEAYFADKSFGEALWKRNGEKGLSEYTMEMGKKYVKHSDRDADSSFVRDVWKFISSKEN